MKYFLILSFISLSLFSSSLGNTLYSSCKYCHGEKANKIYANIVPSIKENSYESLESKLLLYKEGNLDIYGFGPIMKQQMKNIPKDKISILTDYIQKL